MKDTRLSSQATRLALQAHAMALASGESPGGAFERAWRAHAAEAPGISMWESQAIVVEAIGIRRRDRNGAP